MHWCVFMGCQASANEAYSNVTKLPLNCAAFKQIIELECNKNGNENWEWDYKP